MKHIKSYENYYQREEYPIYAIYKSSGNGHYLILKLLSNTKFETKITKMYTSNQNKEIKEYDVYSPSTTYNTQSINLYNNIVFKAKTVEECLTELKILLEADKYNL